VARGNWDLPETVRLIAEVTGREDALFLAGHVIRWGGRSHYGRSSCIYIPRSLTADHRLVRLLGLENARRLAAALGGEILSVAPCKGVFQRFRDNEVRRLAVDGMKVSVLATMVGVSERHIRSIIAA